MNINLEPEDRSLLIRIALIIATGLLIVLLAGQCTRSAHAAIGSHATTFQEAHHVKHQC